MTIREIVTVKNQKKIEWKKLHIKNVTSTPKIYGFIYSGNETIEKKDEM